MMNILIWVVIGGIVGWLASLIMRTDAQQGILMNIVVGIVGAFLGGLVFSGGDLAAARPDDITSFLIALLGAVVLLAIVNLVRRRSIR